MQFLKSNAAFEKHYSYHSPRKSFLLAIGIGTIVFILSSLACAFIINDESEEISKKATVDSFEQEYKESNFFHKIINPKLWTKKGREKFILSDESTELKKESKNPITMLNNSMLEKMKIESKMDGKNEKVLFLLNKIKSAVPVTLPLSLLMFAIVFFLSIRKERFLGKSSGCNAVAPIVGEYIFLPMFAKFNEQKQRSPSYYEGAKRAAIKKICEWGYTEQYAIDLANRNLSEEIKAESQNFRFQQFILRLGKLNKNELYEGVYSEELPPEEIKKMSNEIANSFRHVK